MKVRDWVSMYRTWHPEFRVVWIKWVEERIYCEMWDCSIWWTPDGERFYWYGGEVYHPFIEER